MNDPITGKESPLGVMRPLLPNEPRVPNPVHQTALTAQHLLPVLGELEAFCLAVRAKVDEDLPLRQPTKLGKPYPLGQCLEISHAAQHLLREAESLSFSGSAEVGRRAFVAFRKAGGTLRMVWGDLRRKFFQNAFQVGSLYVDVSNDTVTPTKPKVEILPFGEADLIPIADFQHFRRVALAYWSDRIYPNHVLPDLAPYFPFIHVSSMGRIRVHEASDYMIAMAQAGRFVPSEEVLREAAMPSALFQAVAKALEGWELKVPGTEQEGRLLALRACRERRAKRLYLSKTQTSASIALVCRVNRHLLQKVHGLPVTTTLEPASLV